MRKGMMTVLLAIALIASSVIVAHAGGGAGSAVNATLLDCYLIHNGATSPHTLEVVDQFGTRTVRLGKARLLCTQTTSATVVEGPVLNPNFDPNVADHLKCSDVVPPVDGPGAVVAINDPFSVETVALDKLSVLCSPATKTVISP